MNTKNTIASWLLALFILAPFSKAFYAVIEALNLHRPVGTILWLVGITFVVAASGLFLIVRFVAMIHDLEYYKSEEKQREKELSQKGVTADKR